MKLIISMNKENYKRIKDDVYDTHDIHKAIISIRKGVPLDDLNAEIEQIEINGHIRDVECFSAGINTVLNVIDKYRKGTNE